VACIIQQARFRRRADSKPTPTPFSPQASLHDIAGRTVAPDQPRGDSGADIPGDRGGWQGHPEHHRATAALCLGEQDPGQLHGDPDGKQGLSVQFW